MKNNQKIQNNHKKYKIKIYPSLMNLNKARNRIISRLYKKKSATDS